MKRIKIEEIDIDDKGNEIVIDSETLNICDRCVNGFDVCDSDTVTIEDTSYDGDCDECYEFEDEQDMTHRLIENWDVCEGDE